MNESVSLDFDIHQLYLPLRKKAAGLEFEVRGGCVKSTSTNGITTL